MAHSTEELAELARQWQAAAVEAFQEDAKEALDTILASENPAELLRAQLEAAGTDSEDDDEPEEYDNVDDFADAILRDEMPEHNLLPRAEGNVLRIGDNVFEGEEAEAVASAIMAKVRVWPGMPGADSLQPHAFDAMLDQLGEGNEDAESALADAGANHETWASAVRS